MSLKDRFNRNDKPLKIVIIYVILAIASLISIYPMLNILSIALRPKSRLLQDNLKIIPDNATLENFKIALFERPFGVWLTNSLIIALIVTMCTIILSFTAAYAFSRYKFKGKSVGLTAFLLTQIFPAPMLLLPTFILLRKFDLINSYIGLIIPYIATSVPFCVWTLKGFFDTVPFSIEESAFIDGASLPQIFTKIITPLSLPAIGITALFAFSNSWNEYVVARIVLTDDKMLTLPVALTNLQGQFTTDWGIFAAASFITAIPIMIVFISLSKFLVGGLTLGGVKG